MTAVALEQAREDAIALFGELPAECDPLPGEIETGTPLELDGPADEWPPSDPAELAALDAYTDAAEAEWIAKNGPVPF